MRQRIEKLSPEDNKRIEKHREWVKSFNDESKASYETVTQKLRLIDQILKSSLVRPDEKWKLQSLGIPFGDALAQEKGLMWVAVEDSFGRDPALCVTGTTILLFPLTTISKRIERGEGVDVFQLFDDACRTIEVLRGKLKTQKN